MYQMRIGPPLSRAVKELMIVNAVIFGIDMSLRIFFKTDILIYLFGLSPGLVFGKFYIWQIFTYQFMHGGFFHILFNMLALWMFGAELEMRWGRNKFIQFYLATGTITGVMIFVFNYLMGYDAPTIGASGVVFAIMVAYAVYWGNRVVYLWMLVPIRVKYFVVIMGLVSFISMVTPGQSGISHIGHLGGIISGYLYLKLVMDRHGGGGAGRRTLRDRYKIWKKKKEWEKKDQKRYDNMNTEQVVDEILSKISRQGMKSLTLREKQFLRKTSEKMNEGTKH